MRLTIFLVISSFLSTQAQDNKSLNELISSEKSFAKKSENSSTKAAFLEYLSPNAILFRNGIVNGKLFWENVPEGVDKLIWEPQFADISNGGDFGYTTGPFQQFQNRSDTIPIANGHYVSIWIKEDNVWKVLFDGGIVHPKADLSNWETKATLPSISSKTSIEVVKKIISKLEFSFNEKFNQKGAFVYTDYLSKEGRIYRPRKAPFRSNNITELFTETDKKFNYETHTQIQVAPFGDMAFIYGNVDIEIRKDNYTRILKGNYIRIWKKESLDDWKIVVDMISI